MTGLAPDRPVMSPALVAARYLLRGYLRVALWYAGAVVLLGTLIPLVISRAGNVGVSIIEVSWQAGLWFGFSLSASFGVSYLSAHVSFGMTRRAYWQAVLLAAAGFGAALAVFQTAALALERWWYDAMGWSGTGPEGLVVPGDSLGATAGRYLLLYVTAILSGTVVALVYTRFGGWIGTLSLPLSVGPLLVAGALLVEADGGKVLTALGVSASRVGALGTVGALAVPALLVVALILLVRGYRLTTPPR